MSIPKQTTFTATDLTLSDVERMARQMPGGFFIYRADETEGILYVNDIVLDIFGCDTLDEFKELTGYTFKGLVYPDDLAAVEASILEQVEASDKNLDYVEYRIRRKDGTIRWIDDYGHLLHTKDYGDVYYVFICDITDLHASREESRRHAKVIEGLSVDFSSIYLLNLETGSMHPYRQKSKYFCQIAEELGLASEEDADWREVLSRYAEHFVWPEDRELYRMETMESRIKERINDTPSYSVTYRCQGESGKVLYTEMSVVRIEEETLHNYVVMGYRDVTEQIARVQEDLSAKLRMEVELEREKRANEAKSEFLFNISHDIRTPMNAIMGFTDLARKHIDNPDLLRDYLGKVDEANHHLLALIDDILEMSRIDYSRIDLKSDLCDLKKQLDMVLDMFRLQAEEKQLVLQNNFDLPEVEVYLDSNRFRRIMGNLVGNAVKFTPKCGQISISARQKRVSESGYARYEFTVKDSGVGMTEDFMRRMFEAFEREENSTKTGYTGTGLGLAITKKLLDAMGGSISVQSKKGEGSTFTVDLPLRLGSHEGNTVPQDRESEYHAAGKHRILLVEDIEINRMLAETVLKEAGFLVESVADGCDAVEIIKSHPIWYYDLVLMDIQMPIMNGYEATRSIRALGRKDTDRLPIIALSANAREEDKQMSMKSGMNHHVAKPFDIAHLIATVNEHIAARNLGDETSS